jgi:hypothetical protein
MTTDAAKRFPLIDWEPDGDTCAITSVPWALVDTPKVRELCLNIHEQTIERLAERGGLSPRELWCHLHAPDGIGDAWQACTAVKIPSTAELRAWFRANGAMP